jgi:hypothetical protein
MSLARRTGPFERMGLLTIAFVVGTIGFGWWSVPVIGLAWGLVAWSSSRPAGAAGVAALLAWALLLAWTATTGPLLVLINKLGAVAQVPGAVFVVFTLLLPFALAGTAAAVGASIRLLFRPAAAGSGPRDPRP